MGRTLLNGSEEIQSGSIPWAQMVSGAIVPTASLVDGAKFIKSDGTVSMTASLTSSDGTPLVSQKYVDAKTGGIGGLHDVRILSAANIGALSGLSAIDGVTPIAGDIILLTAQSTGAQNGPWVAAAGAWTRPTWWPSASVVNEGQYFMIAEGTSYKDTKWWCTTVGTITVDTTATTFVQDSTGAVYSAGTGLGLAGNTFSVTYGTASGTAAQGNDSRITGALQTSSLGTGVATALGTAVNTSGGPILATTGNVLAAGQFPALTGDVTSSAGSLATTVNNTSSTGFTKYTNFVINETPSGTINGANTTFSLANTPATANGGVSSLMLFYSGTLLKPGAGNDYTLSGSTITMLFAPANSANGNLTADYMK